ncbi:MAG: hypothetical protein M1434_04460 [Chloroflexi bacterium]|nr:hypothetical protein [Chloroflexota bacterium]MCL5273986.1 hypothetical protein [Chloroflexota bacterium]
MSKVKILSISHYVQSALKLAHYAADENGVIIAFVPGASGFFSQGINFEEARDAIVCATPLRAISFWRCSSDFQFPPWKMS